MAGYTTYPTQAKLSKSISGALWKKHSSNKRNGPKIRSGPGPPHVMLQEAGFCLPNMEVHPHSQVTPPHPLSIDTSRALRLLRQHHIHLESLLKMAKMYENFKARILQTLVSLRELAMTEEWKITLEVWDDNYLLSYINAYTPDHIKHLLDGEEPPTFEQLMEFNWTDTSDPGVYARLIWPTSESSHPHVYVGSATSIMGGLRKRKGDHEAREIGKACAYDKILMSQPGVTRKARFIVLYRMQWGSRTVDDINLIRKLCLLSEAVFATILGAYMLVADKDVRLACPYGNPEVVFDWRGACTHSALSESQRLMYAEKYDRARKPKPSKQDRDSEKSKTAWITTGVRFTKKWRDNLTPEQLEACREKDKLAMREYRKTFRHLILARKANRTPEEVAEHKHKKKMYQRRYREEHAEEIKAREALIPPEIKKERAARSKLRTQKSRLKKRLADPKPPRVIPPHRKKRNADRMRQRKGDPDFNKISKLGTRVKRARDNLKNLERAGASDSDLNEAKKKFAVTFVERYNLMVRLGRSTKDKPTAEQIALAASARHTIEDPAHSVVVAEDNAQEVDESCSEDDDGDMSEDEVSESDDEIPDTDDEDALDTDDEEILVIPDELKNEATIPSPAIHSTNDKDILVVPHEPKNKPRIPLQAARNSSPAPKMSTPWTIAANVSIKKQEKKPEIRAISLSNLTPNSPMVTPWTMAKQVFHKQQKKLQDSLAKGGHIIPAKRGHDDEKE